MRGSASHLAQASTMSAVENGIKPVYVFDGKPPNMKGGELAKRQEKRAEAQEGLEKATEAGDSENVDKFSRRLVKVTKEHVDDCRRLLTLMGVPYVDVIITEFKTIIVNESN